jgi:NADP-dependent 3-hydroxy acid dehydrogenase YdfG
MSNYKKMSANQVQKVAIVTGSSSGIGRTTAIALAKVGNKVALAARQDNRISCAKAHFRHQVYIE